MAHRTKKSQRREEHERILQEMKHKKQKKIAIVAIAIAVLVAVAILAPRPAPDYVQCFGNSHTSPAQQHFHPHVFVQIGDDLQFGADFIRVPDNMGVRSSCMWAVHVHEGDGARGLYFTTLHVESPYPWSQHAYTLGDLFESWGEWYSRTNSSLPYKALYLGPDGVSHVPSDQPTYYGNTEVRIGRGVAPGDVQGPWNPAYGWVSQPASREIVLNDGDFVHVWVHGDF